MLIRVKSSVKVSQKPALDGIVGLSGGFMGGFAGLAGLLPTLWVGMQNLPKNVQRGTFEPYILIVNLIAIIAFFTTGMLSTQTGVDLLWAFPALIFGSWLGVKVYPFINEAVFRKNSSRVNFVIGINAFNLDIYRFLVKIRAFLRAP